MKKQKKKRKLKIGRVFLLFMMLSGISFALIKFVDIPIMSITIKGNNLLSDQEVIKQAKLEDYPSFLSTFTFTVKKRLLENDYVETAKVTKGIFNIKIDITEKKILYVDSNTNEKVTIDSRFKDDKEVCVPFLINTIPDEKMKYFLKKMNKIDSDILCLMSQIKYDPNEIDKDRYYVFMNDGNSVYLTVNKFNKINKYNSILENVGRQNGTLYLDYGDYFQVK